MTENSWYWPQTSVGDATDAPYDDDEFSDIWRKLFLRDRTLQGVIEDYENELAVSNPAGNTIRTATGAALVDGKFYETDANVDIVIATPAVLTRIDRVVLRKSWAGQTVRVAILTGVEGGGVPALTQTDGVTWEIPLAQVSITTAPAITITDERVNARTPLGLEETCGMQHIETIVADGASTNMDFLAIPATFRHLFLIGNIRIAGAVVDADVDIRFNGDAGANYNEQDLIGANAAPSASAAINQTAANVGTFPGATGIANHIGQLFLYIADYANSSFYKSFNGQFSSIPNDTVADFDVGNVSGLWQDVTAINRIVLVSSSGNVLSGSTVSLYGMN